MSGPFSQDKLENWVSDFCVSDALRAFSPETREAAEPVLLAFMTGACEARSQEPEDLEETDVRQGLLGSVGKQAVPEGVRNEVPALCGAFLGFLEAEGRLSGGRRLGAFVGALRGAYLEEASGRVKPIVRAGSKLGRHDPCPCGSGKKYKKCCARE